MTTISIEPGKGRGKRGRTRVRMDGAITIYDAAAGKQTLLEALADSRELEIDVSGVTEMDSAGLQLLVMVKREATVHGKRANLVGHSTAVLEVLDCYGLAAFFGDAVVIPSGAKRRRS
jgi:anti-sigma B factor antagonist